MLNSSKDSDEHKKSLFGQNNNTVENAVSQASEALSKTEKLTENEEDFRKFLEENLNFSRELPINKNFTPGHQLLKAYEYFDGIDDVIYSFFDIDNGEISSIQYQLVF